MSRALLRTTILSPMKSNSFIFWSPLALIILSIPSTANAATGMFGSYVEIFTTSSEVYVAQSYTAPEPNDGLDGAFIGNFTVADNLSISSASGLTFKNSGAGEDVFGVTMSYQVYPTLAGPSAFTAAPLNFGSNAPSTDLGGNSFTGSGDQEWAGLSGGSIDLMALTSGPGDYSIEVFYTASTNQGDRFSNNGGSNYIATFTVIPEPSATVLLLGASFGMVLRRRR